MERRFARGVGEYRSPTLEERHEDAIEAWSFGLVAVSEGTLPCSNDSKSPYADQLQRGANSS